MFGWFRKARQVENTLEQKVQQKEAELRLKLLETTVNWFDTLVDLREPFYDTPDFWFPVGNAEQVPPNIDSYKRGEVIPLYTTEWGLKMLRDQSRRLAALNEFAINALTNRVSYTVGKGYQYQAVPKRQDYQPLADQMQAVIDEFLAINCWCEREQEIAWRADRDGEAFLRFFEPERGQCLVRFVEPEHVRAPKQDVPHAYGVETDPDDIETVVAYWIVENPNVSWEPVRVPAAEVLHVRLNSDSTAKRGVPTLHPVRKNLERADTLLRNMSTLAAVQATYAVIRKHKRFGKSAIDAYQQANADLTINNPVGGLQTALKRLLPGSIIDTGEETDYQFPATHADASGFVGILQAELRAVAARLVMPEYMLTTDSSNANYASTLVSEAPSVKNFERLQAFYGRRFGDGPYESATSSGAVWRAVLIAVEAGRLPREVLEAVEIQAEAPSIVARDKGQETNRSKTLNEAGVLSKSTWSKWEGVDPEQEQRQIDEDGEREAKRKPQEQPLADQGQPQGGGLASLLGEAEQAIDRLLEACVPNEHGTGSHDDKTGYPCSLGGAADGVKKKSLLTAAKELTAGATAAAKSLGSSVWNRLPRSAQKAAALAMTLGQKAVKGSLYAMDTPLRIGKQLAVQVARERGLSTEHVGRVERIVNAIDQGATIPGLHVYKAALTPILGPIGAYVPVAALSYIGYSTVRNPLATIRAARKLVASYFGRSKTEGIEDVQRPSEDTVARVFAAFEAAGDRVDWYEALLSAAVDESGGDLAKALDAADKAFAANREPQEADLAEGCVANRDGKGHHDDKTGHPCSVGGGDGSGSKAQAKLDPNLHPVAKAQMGRIVGSLRAAKGLSSEQRVSYFHASQAVLGRMPEKALKRFAANTTEDAVFYPSNRAIAEGLVSVYPSAQDKLLADGFVVGGAYAGGRLHLDGDYEGQSGDKNEAKTAVDLYAHEMSHAVDGPDHALSNSSEWHSAFKAELAGGKLTAYAASKPSEGWAEFGRALLSGRFDPARVKSAFPTCYAVWQSHGLTESLEMAGVVWLSEDEGVSLPEVFAASVDLPDGGHADMMAE